MKVMIQNSGYKIVDIMDINKDDFTISYLAKTVGYINRWCGKLHTNWTVLDHSIICYLLANVSTTEDSSVKLSCLIHDLEEAFFGDVITPVKEYLNDYYTDCVVKIDNMIGEKLKDMNLNYKYSKAYKKYDEISKLLEEVYFLGKDVYVDEVYRKVMCEYIEKYKDAPVDEKVTMYLNYMYSCI